MRVHFRSNDEDGEQVIEFHKKSVEKDCLMTTRLRVAAFIFDNIPSSRSGSSVTIRIVPVQLSMTPMKKRVTCSMKLSRDQYLSLFSKLGKRKDLCHLAIPPEDRTSITTLSHEAFELYYQYVRRKEHKSKETSLLSWDGFPESERRKYNDQLDHVKLLYNQAFSKEEEQKREGVGLRLLIHL